VETVLIPVVREAGTKARITLCVSSQVGCAMNCQFCYTGGAQLLVVRPSGGLCCVGLYFVGGGGRVGRPALHAMLQAMQQLPAPTLNCICRHSVLPAGRMGLQGNLTAAQIVEQVVAARRLLWEEDLAAGAPRHVTPIT
jgi:adenine C2-methylase RlmN of 23S rRNA A2503 and tRNA A37